jgi:hypothetical protein
LGDISPIPKDAAKASLYSQAVKTKLFPNLRVSAASKIHGQVRRILHGIDGKDVATNVGKEKNVKPTSLFEKKSVCSLLPLPSLKILASPVVSSPTVETRQE